MDGHTLEITRFFNDSSKQVEYLFIVRDSTGKVSPQNSGCVPRIVLKEGKTVIVDTKKKKNAKKIDKQSTCFPCLCFILFLINPIKPNKSTVPE